eukprot:6179489-Pleurochrysis_carterae.AAC.1
MFKRAGERLAVFARAHTHRPPCPATRAVCSELALSHLGLTGARAVACLAHHSVDARLDEDESELGVLVAAELVEVLAHGDGLLDEAVEVLGDLGRQAALLQDAQNLGARHMAHLPRETRAG